MAISLSARLRLSSCSGMPLVKAGVTNSSDEKGFKAFAQ